MRFGIDHKDVSLKLKLNLPFHRCVAKNRAAAGPRDSSSFTLDTHTTNQMNKHTFQYETCNAYGYHIYTKYGIDETKTE